MKARQRVRRFKISTDSAAVGAEIYSADDEHDDDNHTCGKKPLLNIKEVPEYMQGNPYIWSGYRVNFNLGDTVMSLFYMHNETLNVWTHLLGMLLFLWLMVYSLATWLFDAPPLDKIMFCVWALAAQFQNFSSTFFHWFCCINSKVWGVGQKLDYTAIAVLICGSNWPLFHYLFYCHPFWQFVYISSISLVGICGIAMSWVPYFQRPSFQSLRASLFVAMALIPLLSIPHFSLFIPSIDLVFPVIWRLTAMGATYIAGAVIYASKVPEKFYPGTFDTGFNSHVIWHFFTIAAAYFHYCALRTAHELNLEYATCLQPAP